MSSTGSVSRWLEPLQQGDEAAVERLWERIFVTLVKLARGLLGHKAARAVDGEDVALSAFDSFCRHAAQGHFPRLADRDDLWRLLAVITARKALRTRRDEGRLKRGGGERLNAEALDDEALLRQACSQEPSPELAAQFAEEYARLLQLLDDEQLRQVALLRMENYTVEEIAAKVGCALRSVKRKLQLIRNLWENEKPS